jgi:hypothetical protein
MTNLKHLDLAVIEARWWNKGNHSVRPMFDTLAGMHCQNPFAYHYEMFSDAASFDSVVRRLGRTRGIQYLHVACHGEEGGKALYGAGESRISRAKIRNAFDGSKLKGVYFGACDFGNMFDLKFLLDQGGNSGNGTVWIAGYKKSPDWIESAALEMFFWHQFYRNRRGSEVERVAKLAKNIDEFMTGAHDKLGFDIFVGAGDAAAGSRE